MHNIVFADSSEVCSGIVILGLVVSLVFAQKKQDNRPQHLIHVHWTDQVTLYNHQICRPRFQNISISLGTWRTLMHENLCLLSKLNFCEKWIENLSTLPLVYEAAVGVTDPDKASL